MTLTPMEKKRSPHGVISQCIPSSTVVLQRESGASRKSLHVTGERLERNIQGLAQATRLLERSMQMLSTSLAIDETSLSLLFLFGFAIEGHEYFEFEAPFRGFMNFLALDRIAYV
jgi:hypothetical protein